MPELPDLQAFSRHLSKLLVGKKLARVKVLNRKKLKTSEAKLRKSIEGTLLKRIYREGKELHLKFSNGTILGLHLMLHGKLNLFEENNPEKYPIIELLFSDNTGLALSDYQGMATPTLNPEVKASPDALSKDVNYKFLKEQASKKRTTIKSVLMDQNIVRGIGNAYADEILWDAGISPLSIANKIPDAELKLLAKSIRSVLRDAEKQIIKKDPKIISGEIRDFLKIHNAKKKKSPTGGTIKNQMLNSRITYFTGEQKLYK